MNDADGDRGGARGGEVVADDRVAVQAAPFIPDRRNRQGDPVYRVEDLPERESYDVLLGVREGVPVWGRGDELAACQAMGSERHLDPLSAGSYEAYMEQPSCRLLALHDGPHAYPLGGIIDSFEECRCRQYFDWDRPCWHTPDGAAHCDPAVTIRVEAQGWIDA